MLPRNSALTLEFQTSEIMDLIAITQAIWTKDPADTQQETEADRIGKQMVQAAKDLAEARVKKKTKTRVTMWHTMRGIYVAGFKASLNIFHPIQIDAAGSDVTMLAHKLEGSLPDRTLRQGRPFATENVDNPPDFWLKTMPDGTVRRFNNWWEVSPEEAMSMAELLREQRSKIEDEDERTDKEKEDYGERLDTVQTYLKEAEQRSVRLNLFGPIHVDRHQLDHGLSHVDNMLVSLTYNAGVVNLRVPNFRMNTHYPTPGMAENWESNLDMSGQ